MKECTICGYDAPHTLVIMVGAHPFPIYLTKTDLCYHHARDVETGELQLAIITAEQKIVWTSRIPVNETVGRH